MEGGSDSCRSVSCISDDGESGHLLDAANDLLRYGVSTLWAAATDDSRGSTRIQIGATAAASSVLSVSRVSGPVAEEVSKRLRTPTSQCPFAFGHVPPEVARVWSSEVFAYAANAMGGAAELHASQSGSARPKHRLRTTVWVMGNVSGALKALQQGQTVGRSNPERPLPPYAYQHVIVRSAAVSGYSLLIHPDAMQVGTVWLSIASTYSIVLVSVGRASPTPPLFHILQRMREVFSADPATAALYTSFCSPARGARGSGVGLGGWGVLGHPAPIAASSLRSLRPVAACANWSQALLLSVEGDVYQWRVSEGRLLPDEDEVGASCSTTPAATVLTPSHGVGDAGKQPTPLALPPIPAGQATPHGRFYSVSERLTVLERCVCVCYVCVCVWVGGCGCVCGGGGSPPTSSVASLSVSLFFCFTPRSPVQRWCC
jgi:hypothetical protein